MGARGIGSRQATAEADSSAALRNDKQEQAEAKYGDSGFARMTDSKAASPE